MTRGFFILCIAVLLVALSIDSVDAQPADDFPNRPVKIVVPYPPGGSTDALARTLGAKIGHRLGQPVVVENRPGASGNIGAVYAAGQPADGYTLFIGTSTALAVNPALFKSLPYDPQRDFTPLILATTMPSVVVAHSDVPVATLTDLVGYLRSRPGKGSFASAGNGTPAHLGGELFKRMAHVDVYHVPYKGGMPALTELASGQTTYMIAVISEAMPFVKAGRMKALAVTTRTRLQTHPELPTVAEQGLGDFELIAWFGFLAPARTPPAVVAKLSHAFNEALQDRETWSKLSEMGFVREGGAPERLSELMRTETAKWRKVIDEANIRPD